jgi:hypothetical protein
MTIAAITLGGSGAGPSSSIMVGRGRGVRVAVGLVEGVGVCSKEVVADSETVRYQRASSSPFGIKSLTGRPRRREETGGHFGALEAPSLLRLDAEMGARDVLGGLCVSSGAVEHGKGLPRGSPG